QGHHRDSLRDGHYHDGDGRMTQTKKHWTWEEHELSTGYSAVVYDPDGIAIDTHIAAEKAEHIANCMNACAGLNPAAIPDVVEALRHLTEEHIERGPDDVPLGAIRQSDAINRAVAALVALQAQS